MIQGGTIKIKMFEENLLNAHIFIDADNIKPEIGFQAIEKFSFEYFVVGVDIIGNETTLSSRYLEASDRYNIKNCYYGKNSADTWLCTEIAKTIFENPAVEVVIIVSSDRDFLAAIKLVTDQNKKIIFVSDGNGHKNLKALLYDLRINPDLIQLVDFKTDLTVEKKKGSIDSMEIFSPNPTVNKVREIRKKVQPQMQIFFTKHEAEFKFISIEYEGRLIEIPFIDGINLTTFTNILISLRIIQKAEPVKKIIADSSLKIVGDNVYIDTDAEKNISVSNSKLEKLLKQNLPTHSKTFITKNAENIQFIKVNNAGKFIEIPFVDGVNFSTYTNFLMALKIIPNGKTLQKIIDENPLQLISGQIFLDKKTPAVSQNPFDDVINYFTKHAAETKNIFIKCNGVLQEIPFVNGVPLNMFSRLLKGYAIAEDSAEIKKIIADSFLNLRDNKIYFQDEETLSADLKSYLQKLPSSALEFIRKNEDKLKIVAIAHNDKVYKVPFVEGIHLSIFVNMLRTLNIFGKSTNSSKVLTANDFTIQENSVYKKGA